MKKIFRKLEQFKIKMKFKLMKSIIKFITHTFVIDERCLKITSKHDGTLFDSYPYCGGFTRCSHKYKTHQLYISNSYRYDGYTFYGDSELECYLDLLKRLIGNEKGCCTPFRKAKYTKEEE